MTLREFLKDLEVTDESLANFKTNDNEDILEFELEITGTIPSKSHDRVTETDGTLTHVGVVYNKRTIIINGDFT